VMSLVGVRSAVALMLLVDCTSISIQRLWQCSRNISYIYSF